ncbi:MAG: acyl-CoA synthetase (AMP-forming)/AMP-acid ligase II [Candidatus Rokubacteria bacterium CSP1-6]|nr:MAG: acyl-CoA synthetase (AMP-forming)/AMP-acid ligase II [Candidatus Rokubacteria bacterium CSP1-6]
MHIGHFLTRAARRYPDRPAWLEGDLTIPFREAEARVNRLARALLSLGGQPGDRVAMLIPNCSQGIEALLAPMKAGMAVVPMNIRLHPSEHEYMLNDSGAFALIYGEEFREHLAQVRESLPSVKHFICVGRGSHGDLAYDQILDGQPETPPDATIEPDDLAWLFYTSGTTGHPKGAMLTHRNLITMAEQFLLNINPARPDDVLLHAAPITHGSGCSIFHHIAVGAASAFPATRSFDPPKIFEAIQRYRATTLFLVPTMINVLLASPDRTRYDLSSLHTIFYGGAPMYVEQLQSAVSAFGPIFVQLFGQGEAPMACTSLPKEEHLAGDDPVKLKRLASAGRETTAVRVRVVNDEDREVPAGQMGEIVVRGDLVMKGYWRKPEATADTLRGGWLHTGDIGYLDSDGYLYITDRKKDMIISGGSNIYPREIEEVICRHPAVFEVAVIGIPDEKWGETVKALVVPREGMRATEAEIIEHCKRHMASYKKPQSVEFLPALPKNAYGKVLKRELRDRYWAGRQRKV